MEGSDPSLSQPSRRRKIKGPRPTPLAVRNDSRTIIKRQPPAPPRRPVIIYTVSPKVIHAHCSEFMSLVQRLTGLASPALPPASPPPPISQAARPATFEKTVTDHSRPPTICKQLAEVLDQLGIDAAAGGVLSQLVPSCLPAPVLPELLTASQLSVDSFNVLSPALHGNGMAVATPILPSPVACWELLDENPNF